MTSSSEHGEHKWDKISSDEHNEDVFKGITEPSTVKLMARDLNSSVT